MNAWTDDRVAALKSLWREGRSGTQVARELRITRNAAMGKLNRLGLLGYRYGDRRAWKKLGSPPAAPVPPSPPRAFSWEQHA